MRSHFLPKSPLFGRNWLVRQKLAGSADGSVRLKISNFWPNNFGRTFGRTVLPKKHRNNFRSYTTSHRSSCSWWRASQIVVDHFPISPNPDCRLPQSLSTGTRFPVAPHLAADTIEAPSLSGPSWSRPTGISGRWWDCISMFPCAKAPVRHDWPMSK